MTLRCRYQDQFDALIIPGGAKGAETISQTSSVQKLVRQYLDKNKIVGMICAGQSDYFFAWRPINRYTGSLTALTSNLPKQPLTSHPSVKDQLDKRSLTAYRSRY